MQNTTVADIANHVGQQVRIQGWVYNRTDKGKLCFLLVRDGTGYVQCVAFKGDLDEKLFDQVMRLPQESSVKITGTVREDKRAPGIPGGFEIGIKEVEIVQAAEPDYPMALKDHGVDFALDHRHLWIRMPSQWAILRVRVRVMSAVREFLDSHGFFNLDTPILTPAAAEGTTTLFETPYFDEGFAYLAQTGQLYLEAACVAYGKVYNFGPTFRAEKSKTRRHLTEFWMLDAEVAYADSADNMRLQEDMVSRVVSDVLANCGPELAAIERDVEPLKKVTPPFIRMDYGDAVKTLQGKGSAIQWGDDLGGEDETILTKLHDKPIFVMNYPKKAKAFYMKENPENPETVLCSDLLAPEGYGEIIGGSQREDILSKLLARIHEEKLPEDAYGWYLDLRKYGSVPHSGYGIGLERTLAWICGSQHIRECIPFPRTISRIYP